MERREFVKSIFISLVGAPILLECNADLNNKLARNNKRKITFGVCADVHQDLFPNVEDRLSKFVKQSNDLKVDFIIQLGDFCFPIEENKNFIKIWNSFKGPNFHVLGNHDHDRGTKLETLKFWGGNIQKSYYSFDAGEFHFIVLDPNYIYEDGKYVPYNGNSYLKKESSLINYVTPEQLEWLKEDLSSTLKPTCIFSHQSPNRGISNREKLMEIIREANSGNDKKVIASFSGHHHLNWHVVEDSVNYVQINSLCYWWGGDKYTYENRYTREINEKYPVLKKMVPYKDPLYAFVELDLDNKKIRITGIKSEFIPPTPFDLGYLGSDQFAPSPSISSRVLNF